MNFKAGDKVKCIDDVGVHNWLSTGEKYEVTGMSSGGWPKIQERFWSPNRFELIEKREDMQENNALGFKIGDKVKIIRKDDTFGWYDGMEDLLGTEQVITHVGYSGKGCSYLICGWYFPDGALELVQQPKKFNPKPGDKIICNNGEEFTCCTLEHLRQEITQKICSSDPIIGYDGVDGWCSWLTDGTCGTEYPGWFIREVIPQQKYEAPSKAEPMYSAEDICKAFITDLGWHEYSFGLLMESLEKVKNPEYMEYPRLKTMFESDEE